MSVSGLTRTQRIRCRDLIVQAAMLAYKHRSAITYTQAANKRWDGIKLKKNASEGEFPSQADCSSFATWCLWNGLFLKYGLSDLVNDADWTAGYTGTMRSNGMKVELGSIVKGDCVFYSKTATLPAHVGVVVGGTVSQNLMVVEHGSDAAPLHLPYDYRPVSHFRRYV